MRTVGNPFALRASSFGAIVTAVGRPGNGNSAGTLRHLAELQLVAGQDLAENSQNTASADKEILMPAIYSLPPRVLNFGICLLACAWLIGFASAQPDNKPPIQFDVHGAPLPRGAIARLGTLRFRFFDGRVPAIACSH